MLRLHHPLIWNFLGWFVPVLLFGGLAAAAVVLFTRPQHRPWAPPHHDAAVAQVRYRYATGQITRDEYFRLMADLGAAAPLGPPPPTPPAGSPAPRPPTGLTTAPPSVGVDTG